MRETRGGGERVAYSEDGVASVLERRTTRLDLHRVDNKLDHERVAVLGNLGLGVLVVVELGRGRVGGGGREEARCLAVLGDEELGKFKEHLSPDLSDGTAKAMEVSIPRRLKRGTTTY
jgi:hypothetical protein